MKRLVFSPEELAILATLLLQLDDPGRAQEVILHGMVTSDAGAIGQLVEAGHRLVEATGDRDFRERLNAAIAARETS